MTLLRKQLLLLLGIGFFLISPSLARAASCLVDFPSGDAQPAAAACSTSTELVSSNFNNAYVVSNGYAYYGPANSKDVNIQISLKGFTEGQYYICDVTSDNQHVLCGDRYINSDAVIDNDLTDLDGNNFTDHSSACYMPEGIYRGIVISKAEYDKWGYSNPNTVYNPSTVVTATCRSNGNTGLTNIFEIDRTVDTCAVSSIDVVQGYGYYAGGSTPTFWYPNWNDPYTGQTFSNFKVKVNSSDTDNIHTVYYPRGACYMKNQFGCSAYSPYVCDGSCKPSNYDYTSPYEAEYRLDYVNYQSTPTAPKSYNGPAICYDRLGNSKNADYNVLLDETWPHVKINTVKDGSGKNLITEGAGESSVTLDNSQSHPTTKVNFTVEGDMYLGGGTAASEQSGVGDINYGFVDDPSQCNYGSLGYGNPFDTGKGTYTLTLNSYPKQYLCILAYDNVLHYTKGVVGPLSPNCTAVNGTWSTWSCGTCTGSVTQVSCTRSCNGASCGGTCAPDADGSLTVKTQACPVCTPTWLPTPDTKCQGEVFTQTNNCNPNTQSATGTKDCSSYFVCPTIDHAHFLNWIPDQTPTSCDMDCDVGYTRQNDNNGNLVACLLPPSCPTGVASCTTGQTFSPVDCRSELPNGAAHVATATRTPRCINGCVDNGSCQISACENGYRISGNECVDDVAPEIFATPDSGIVENIPTVTVTIKDANPVTATYELNGNGTASPLTLSSNQGTIPLTQSNFVNNTVSILITATDTKGNTATKLLAYSLQQYIPLITAYAPDSSPDSSINIVLEGQNFGDTTGTILADSSPYSGDITWNKNSIVIKNYSLTKNTAFALKTKNGQQSNSVTIKKLNLNGVIKVDPTTVVIQPGTLKNISLTTYGEVNNISWSTPDNAACSLNTANLRNVIVSATSEGICHTTVTVSFKGGKPDQTQTVTIISNNNSSNALIYDLPGESIINFKKQGSGIENIKTYTVASGEENILTNYVNVTEAETTNLWNGGNLPSSVDLMFIPKFSGHSEDISFQVSWDDGTSWSNPIKPFTATNLVVNGQRLAWKMTTQNNVVVYQVRTHLGPIVEWTGDANQIEVLNGLKEFHYLTNGQCFQVGTALTTESGYQVVYEGDCPYSLITDNNFTNGQEIKNNEANYADNRKLLIKFLNHNLE